MRAPIALVACALILALLCGYAGLDFEAPQQPEPAARGRIALAASEAPAPRHEVRPLEGAPSEPPAKAASAEREPAELEAVQDPQRARLPGERAPLSGEDCDEEEAPGPRSWILPLQLGWDGAEAGEPIARDFAFQPHPSDARGERFRAWVEDAAGRQRSYLLPVTGLIPQNVACEQDELVQGDQYFTLRAPAMLRLPELALPATLELCNPAGETVASYTLREVDGSLRLDPR